MKTNHILFAAATAVALSAGAAQANNLTGNIPLSGTQAAFCEHRYGMVQNPATLVVDLLTTANQTFSSYQVKCNTAFTRTITSANNGFLVGPAPGYNIDYEFQISGGGMTNTGGFQDLLTPLTQNFVATPGPGNQQSGTISVRVKDTVVPGSRPAGLYQDTLTIVVSPNP